MSILKSLYAETQENNNYNFNNRNRNVKCNFENLFTILCNAKSGNEKSILFFIEKYQFLIKKYAFKYKLKNYDADDLIQIGNISIITAINMMIFTVLHFPCATTLLTVKKETGKWKWSLIAFALPTVCGILLCICTNLIYNVFNFLFVF